MLVSGSPGLLRQWHFLPHILNESFKSSKSPFSIKRRLYLYLVLSDSGLAPH